MASAGIPSTFSFRDSIVSLPLRPATPSVSLRPQLTVRALLKRNPKRLKYSTPRLFKVGYPASDHKLMLIIWRNVFAKWCLWFSVDKFKRSGNRWCTWKWTLWPPRLGGWIPSSSLSRKELLVWYLRILCMLPFLVPSFSFAFYFYQFF